MRKLYWMLAFGFLVSCGGKSTAVQSAGQSVSALSFVPADSTFVIEVDWAGVKNSEIYRDLFASVVNERLMNTSMMREFKDKCGFDPVAEIQSFVVGGDLREESFVVVVDGLNKSKTLACAAKDSSVKIDGDYISTGNNEGFLFVSENRFVLAEMSKGNLLSAVSGPGLAQNGAVRKAAAQGAGKTIWFTMLEFPPDAREFESSVGWINVGSSLDGKAVVQTQSAELANGLVQKANEQKGMLAMVGIKSEDVSVSAKGKAVTVQATVSKDSIVQLVKMSGAF